MHKSLLTLVLLTTLGCGCVCNRGYMLSKLYFGLSGPDGGIGQAEFAAFVDQAVTPLFPDGLTQYSAAGQWRNRHGVVVKEPSMVVEIVHVNDGQSQQNLRAIIAAYRDRFAQESVLLIQDSPDRVKF